MNVYESLFLIAGLGGLAIYLLIDATCVVGGVCDTIKKTFSHKGNDKHD